MRSIRKTMQWIGLLLVIAALAGAGYACYVWNESDKLLEQTLLARFHEIIPDWNVSFRRARFDLWDGRIHIYELSLKEVDGRTGLLDVAEAILTVDRERLADPETPMRQVRWRNARLNLVREPDGSWNWQKLTKPKLAKNALPEIHVERAAVSVVFRNGDSKPADALTIDSVNLQLIPSGARQYLVKIAARIPGADAFSVDGNWQVDEGAFRLTGKVKNLAIDSSLSKLTADVSAEYRTGLARLESLLPASDAPGDAAAFVLDPIARMGFKAAADVEFVLTQWQHRAEREYKVSVHLLTGEVATPPLQFPLTDLRGDIELDNQQIRLHELSARSGSTRIRLEQGRILDQGESRPADFDLTITALPLDERLSDLLPGATTRKVYGELHAAGEIDLVTHLEFNGRDRWDHECDVRIKNCSATHERFPYPVEQIVGTLKQRGNRIDIAVQGRAGLQKVVLTGNVNNPGPEAASQFVVEAAGIPIDERLHRACPAIVQNVIDHLRAQGDLSGRVTLERPAGLGQVMSIFVDARLANGSLNCRSFPYALASVSGEFRGQGTTWEFKNVRGRHEAAEIAASGNFRPNDSGRLRLKLDFSATGASFDRQLLAALPEEAQNVWKKLSPVGGLNAGGTVYWWPGTGNRSPDVGGPDSQFQIARLDAALVDARLSLSSFPFPVSDVSARLRYDGDQVRILSFAGRHDETAIRIDDGLIECFDNGEWRVLLKPFYVDDLEATPEFRRSLPKRLRKIVDSLDPRGKQSINGMVEFRGRSDDESAVTAAWETETVYSGTTLNAGVDLCDLYGKSRFSGTWDGEQAFGEGQMKLNTVKVFKYQLTDIEGPVSLSGSQLVLGSKLSPGRRGPVDPDPARHLSAHFIEGQVFLDAVVELGEPMRYGVYMTLKNGDLKRFAQLYMKAGHNKLAGKMNGTIEFKGVGVNPKNLTGGGSLVISPAALYELPVVVQIFNVLSLTPADKTAFKQALFVFSLGGGHVHFDQIKLVGDSIELLGNGRVNFDGNVKLGFISSMGKRSLPIPIVGDIVRGVTKGVVGVYVSGPLDAPVPEVRSLPQMDEALRRLFDNRGALRR
jgi:hypothetical protein